MAFRGETAKLLRTTDCILYFQVRTNELVDGCIMRPGTQYLSYNALLLVLVSSLSQEVLTTRSMDYTQSACKEACDSACKGSCVEEARWMFRPTRLY